MKMAGDYSSLFNFTLPKSMEKFQSALTGMVKPIRDKTGMDITEKTIQQVATNLGVEKTVGQLNQVEKRLLRIISLQDQLGEIGAVGDLAKTLESPSNQLKILQQQVQELGVWLGNVFIGTIGKVLPYINGFVMALVAMAKALAIFVGYKETKYDNDPLQIEETASSADDLTTGLGGATSKAKELKKVLMGFDVLNVITTPSDSGSSGGGGSDMAIDPKILNALKEYDNMMDGVRTKATEIRDKILEWLGFEKLINSETGEITWRLKDGYTNLEKIKDIVLTTIKTIAGFAILTKIAKFAKFIYDIWKIIKNIKDIKLLGEIGKKLSGSSKLLGTIGTITIAITALIAGLKNFYSTNSTFRKGVDELGKSLQKIGAFLGNTLISLFNGIVKAVQPVISWMKLLFEVFSLIVGINWGLSLEAFNGVVNILEKLFSGDIKGAFEAFKQTISNIFNLIVEAFSDFVGDFIPNWVNELVTNLSNVNFFLPDWVADIIRNVLGIQKGIEQSSGETSQVITKFFSLTSDEISSFTAGLGKEIEEQNEMFKNYKATLNSLSNEVDTSIEKLNKLGLKYSLFGEQVTDEDIESIYSAIKDVTGDSTDLVDESANQQIAIISKSFSKTNTLTKERQNEILNTIVKSNKTKKEEIKTAEQTITDIYNNALKERRKLTEEEYERIKQQLEKIRKLCNVELQLSAGEQLAIQQKLNDEKYALNGESYKKLKEQLESWDAKQLELIEQNLKEQNAMAIQAGEEAYEQAIKDGKSMAEAEEIKNRTIEDLQKQFYADYQKDLATHNAEVEKMRNQLKDKLLRAWEELEKKGSQNLTKAEKENKEMYESLLKDFGVTETELLNRASNLGKNTANDIKQSFDNNKQVLSVLIDTSGAYNVGREMATETIRGWNDNIHGKISANVKFANDGNGGYFYGWSKGFATGGFPDVGEMFIAREAGPELVGTIGNRTAVVNNQQIVEAVSRGVAQAVSGVMGRSGGSYNFYLDGNELTSTVTKRQDRMSSVMGV